MLSCKKRRALKHLLGRSSVSDGGDLSAFDDLPTVLGAAGMYVPPGMSVSPAVAQALADAQARLDAARAALAAERQIDQTLGPMGVLMQQQAADAAAAAAGAAPPVYDDGSGSASAQSALDAFRNQGVDPFADDVLGLQNFIPVHRPQNFIPVHPAPDVFADVDSDVDFDSLPFDLPRASRHAGAAYLESDD